MENKNVRKELKIHQNILKMLWCIEDAKINIQSKFHVTPKTKFNFVKNRFCVKIPVSP